MNIDRRTALRLAGVGVVGSLAGCIGENGTDNGNNGNGQTGGIAGYETHPLTVRASLGPDFPEEGTGRVILVDSEERQRAALQPYDPSEDRTDEIGEFIGGIDYGTDRLVVIESVGPNACHDRVEIDGVESSEGRLRADAAVVDTSDEATACAEVVTYPSALLKVTFEGDPADEAAIEITDGWGETATVNASVDDSLSPDPEDLSGYVRPEADADPVEELVCPDEEFERHDQWYDEDEVVLGDMEADGEPVFSLRVEETEYERGETVDIRLTNVSDRTAETGNRAKFNLQVYTDAGWQDVRGADSGPFPYTDEAVIHPPGEGFEWSFELTEEGVVEDAFHDFRVCPGLPAGRYRFAFFGVIGDGILAVEFDLLE